MAVSAVPLRFLLSVIIHACTSLSSPSKSPNQSSPLSFRHIGVCSDVHSEQWPCRKIESFLILPFLFQTLHPCPCCTDVYLDALKSAARALKRATEGTMDVEELHEEIEEALEDSRVSDVGSSKGGETLLLIL